MGNFCSSFQQIGDDESNNFGIKGVNLGSLSRASFPVPDGFVLSSKAYHQYLTENELIQPISQLLYTANFERVETISQISYYIKKLFHKAILPKTITSEVAKMITSNLNDKSCTRIHLSPSLTYSELRHPILPDFYQSLIIRKRRDTLINMIETIFQYPFEPRVLIFANHYKLDPFKLGMAIVVQNEISFEKSGKIYTFNPHTNDKSKIVINAILGVHHTYSKKDTYVLSKKSLTVIDREIALQHYILIQENEKRIPLYLLPKTASAPKLTLKELIELSYLGKRLEKHMFFPQEIDWAKSNGKFYILKNAIIEQNSTPSHVSKKEKRFLKHSSSVKKINGKIRIIKNTQDLSLIQKGDIVIIRNLIIPPARILHKISALITNNNRLLYLRNRYTFPVIIQPSSILNGYYNGQKIAI